MSPELSESSDNEAIERQIRALSDQLDQESVFMSGGYEKLEAFQQVLKRGEIALPVLLKNIQDAPPNWWCMQAVWTIAADMGFPIEFPEEIRGRYDLVRDAILQWGKEQKHIPEDAKSA